MNTAYAVGIWLLLLAWPAMAVIIDGAAGIRAHGLQYKFGEVTQENFRILIPIWGSVKYLINADTLHDYGSRVTLVTTGDETPEFYHQLQQIALGHNYKIWCATPTGAAVQKRRSTSRPVRDRLIRNVLATVTEPYVIPLDADSFPGAPLGQLAGELERRNLDIASVRIMPGNRDESLLTRLQYFEYWLAMQIRFIAPWLVSGACQVARTRVLTDVMSRHSLFFQGNDVEIGLLSEARGYRIGHIAFEVKSDVPATFIPWLRQRLAWAGGQFRLFVVNIWFARRHPFLWFYGAGVATVGLAFRWQVFAEPPRPLLWAAAGGYAALVVYLYLRRGGGNGWVIAMPFYVLFSSFLILPLGPFWYVKMSLEHHNWGVIRPGRRREGHIVKPAKAVKYGHRRAPGAKVTTSLASIVIVVVGLGATITGGFSRAPQLPTGVVTGTQAQVTGVNALTNPKLAGVNGPGVAEDWKDEHSTAIPATYQIVPAGQKVMYAGQPGDGVPLATGDRKIEVFQADFANVKPGQRWRFQITIRGTVFKTYVIVGMEWFNIFKHTAGHVTAYGYKYIAEADVYPHITPAAAQQIAVTSPALPSTAGALAVYVQLPEINPSTSVSITITDASLVRVG